MAIQFINKTFTVTYHAIKPNEVKIELIYSPLYSLQYRKHICSIFPYIFNTKYTMYRKDHGKCDMMYRETTLNVPQQIYIYERLISTCYSNIQIFALSLLSKINFRYIDHIYLSSRRQTLNMAINSACFAILNNKINIRRKLDKRFRKINF